MSSDCWAQGSKLFLWPDGIRRACPVPPTKEGQGAVLQLRECELQRLQSAQNHHIEQRVQARIQRLQKNAKKTMKQQTKDTKLKKDKKEEPPAPAIATPKKTRYDKIAEKRLRARDEAAAAAAENPPPVLAILDREIEDVE